VSLSRQRKLSLVLEELLPVILGVVGRISHLVQFISQTPAPPLLLDVLSVEPHSTFDGALERFVLDSDLLAVADLRNLLLSPQLLQFALGSTGTPQKPIEDSEQLIENSNQWFQHIEMVATMADPVKRHRFYKLVEITP